MEILHKKKQQEREEMPTAPQSTDTNWISDRKSSGVAAGFVQITLVFYSKT